MLSSDPATAPISIMLADSNPLVLSAMAEVFEQHPRFSLVATSSTAEGFLGTAMRVPVTVGVIDWNLPALGGAKLLEVLRAQDRAPRMVVYADQGGEAHLGAMGAGAAGFVARSGSVETLLDTCVAVASGRMVFPYVDVRKLQNNPLQVLSPRETRMLEALATGLTNRELADLLGITTNTVKFHLSNLYDKLSLKNRAQAIAFYYAQKHGDGQGTRGPSGNT